MSRETDDWYEHLEVPWWLLALVVGMVAATVLAGCGDFLKTPCGCPLTTVCQPDPQVPGQFVCVSAPKLDVERAEEPELAE